ncbi:MAG: AI-2E family transporter [Thermoleophilaceae bacterium]
MRFRLRRSGGSERPAAADEFVEIDASELSGLFATPGWLRDVGFTAWLLVGVALLLVGAVWLASITYVIVGPVITAAVVASVFTPIVSWLARHRIPRVAGAILVLLGITALGVGVFWLILSGITSETDALKDHLSSATDEIQGWLDDAGPDSGTASDAAKDASAGATESVDKLLHGVAEGIDKLSSILFFLAMTILSLIFLLADGPNIRRWVEKRMPVPADVAHVVGSRTLQSLRGYFVGVTLVAAFNAVVVGAGALILGVPLAGTIALVTLLGAYVPYLGAWTAGVFSVLIALGGAGTDAAAGMIVVQILANGALQQLVQPLAMGAALGIHPLAVLIVTIAGGALFGGIGLILAAPLTSAATRISTDLARARGEVEPQPPPAGAASTPAPSA